MSAPTTADLTFMDLFAARMALTERLKRLLPKRHADSWCTRSMYRDWIREILHALRALNALSARLYGAP